MVNIFNAVLYTWRTGDQIVVVNPVSFILRCLSLFNCV